MLLVPFLLSIPIVLPAMEYTIELPAFDHHKEWFAAFLRNTTQKEMQKQATLSLLQFELPDVWQRIQDPQYRFVSVFVGAGSGGTEIPLIEELGKIRGSLNNFSTFCEDPAPEMKKEFFLNAKDKIVIEEYSLKSFEDPSYSPPQADLVLASHIWYFIKRWKGVEKKDNTLVKFASLLTERSGVGIITLQSQMSDRYTLNAYGALLRGTDREVVAEEIVDELKRLGIHHRITMVESRLNVESCFQQEQFDPNNEGKCLLSFLIFTSWDELPFEAKEGVKEKFLSQVNNNGKKELILRDLQIAIY
jgi:hypothetical protein